MPLSEANAARAKYRHGASGAVNEEEWTGHAADHDVLAGVTSGPYSVTYVIGAEASNVINVGIQLVDAAGTNVAAVSVVEAYLSDASTGIGISAAAPDVDAIIGTDGAFIVVHTADLAWLLQTEADGHADIDLNDVTGTPTWFMVVVLPNGELAVSAAITFA